MMYSRVFLLLFAFSFFNQNSYASEEDRWLEARPTVDWQYNEEITAFYRQQNRLANELFLIAPTLLTQKCYNQVMLSKKQLSANL